MKINILIFLCLISTLSFSQIHTAPKSFDRAIPYDTVYLQQDCRLIFAMNSDYRFIRLIGHTVDTVIALINSKASEVNLGKLKVDFGDCFALYWDVSTFPTVSVFNKSDGKLILTGISIDIDTAHQRVFYIDLVQQRKLGMFDSMTKKIELFAAPVVPCLWWFDCMASKVLTEKELTITYVDKNNKKITKVYPRSKSQ